MKAIKTIIFLALCAIAWAACSSDEAENLFPDIPDKKLGVADFAIVPGDDPFTFKFENKSTGYKSVEWRFGDDSVSTATSPSHVYMRTGKFDVNLRLLSEDGTLSRKQVTVNIDVQKILSIDATPTGTTNTLRFTYTSTVPIVSVSWDFGDRTAVSTVNSPVHTFEDSKIFSMTSRFKTAKGSLIEIVNLASGLGSLVETTQLATLQVSVENGSGDNSNEGSKKLVDNNINTKYAINPNGRETWMRQTLDIPRIVKVYMLVSGNIAPEWDPTAWVIEGSNDATTWTLLDTRTGVAWKGGARKTPMYFSFPNTTPYLYYRMRLTALPGANVFHLSEWRLYR